MLSRNIQSMKEKICKELYSGIELPLMPEEEESPPANARDGVESWV